MSSAANVKEDEVGAQAHVKPAESAATDAKKPVEEDVGDVPDPDEDDLDDLDDMLNDFSNTKLDAQKPADTPSQPKPETSKPAPSSEPHANPEDALGDEDFAKQLQAGMAELLGDLEKSPDMQKQFEDMFKQMSAAEGTPPTDATNPSAGGAKPAAAPSATDASFQDTIRKTMERMQNSGDQATAAATSGSEDDFMAEMLKQLGGEGGGSEEDFSKMLMGMMEQLTNKEILYEPMKELDEKFPGWLEKNKTTTAQDELKRYEEQQGLVKEIVAKFEETTYSDSNAKDREYIVDRMQKMQALGSPPSDLVGDMASAQEAFAGPDESCNPQ